LFSASQLIVWILGLHSSSYEEFYLLFVACFMLVPSLTYSSNMMMGDIPPTLQLTSNKLHVCIFLISLIKLQQLS
jgi:hypothetical protein